MSITFFMKTFPLLRCTLPALLILTGAGCQQQDGQMQARLADAEARAKLAEAAVEKLKQTTDDLQKKASGSAGDGASSEALAALKQENEALREKIAKASSAPAAGFGIDLEAIEKAFTEGVRERRKEWKEALGDYKVLSYETPEVSAEDVKPFRTNLAIKLEQAGRVFTAHVPVAADFQGNWSFPSAAEVLGFAKRAQAGADTQSSTPVSPSPNLAENTSPSVPPPPPAASPKPAPAPAPEVPESSPFGAKSLQKLPPITFPGDP